MKIRYFAVMFILIGMVAFMGCTPKELTSAKVYIQQDDWNNAITQLEQAVQLYPTNAEAPYLLGEGYGNQGEWEKMNEMYNKSLELAPTYEAQIKSSRDKYWVTAFNSGVNRINSGDLAGAINQFETCLAVEPNRPEAYRNLAIAYTQNGDKEKSKETYEKAVEMNPDDSEVVQALAGAYFEDKEYQKVVDLEKALLEKDPENTDAISNLALALDFLGKKEEAMEIYKEAIKKNPDAKDLLFNLARLHYMRGEYAEAIELFERVIANDPSDIDANINVGNAYLSIADEMRKKLVEKENNGETVAAEEREAMKTFYTNSIPYLKKGVEAQPENVNLWNNLGVAHIQSGNQDEGVACFKKAEELQK